MVFMYQLGAYQISCLLYDLITADAFPASLLNRELADVRPLADSVGRYY